MTIVFQMKGVKKILRLHGEYNRSNWTKGAVEFRSFFGEIEANYWRCNRLQMMH